MTDSRSRYHPRAWPAYWVALGIFVLSLATRLPSLDGMVNVDMYHLWTPRIDKFWAALLEGRFDATYQSHHPGVTLMWLAGGLWKWSGEPSGTLTPERLRLATIPVLCLGSIFPVAAYGFMRKILGPAGIASGLVGLFFATEPLFLAHSANAHLDMMVTGLAWCALLGAILALRSDGLKWAIVSGVLLGLALLTKLSAAGFALGVTALFALELYRTPRRATTLFVQFAVLSSTAAVTVYVAWPALWVAPIQTSLKLYQGLFVEVDKVSAFMYLGHTGKLVLPRTIYAVFAVFLVTPEVIVTLVIGGLYVLVADSRFRRVSQQLTLGSLPFALAITGGSRVGVRYMLPLLPWMLTLAACGLAVAHERLLSRWQNRNQATLEWLLAGGLLALRVLRASDLQPLPITYCSKLARVDCARVFHVGWGEGIKEAALHLEAIERKHLGPHAITVYGSPYASTARVWSSVRSVRRIEDAQILLDYSSDWQRQLPTSQKIARYVAASGARPLYEFSASGRPYVRIFAGPLYRP